MCMESHINEKSAVESGDLKKKFIELVGLQVDIQEILALHTRTPKKKKKLGVKMIPEKSRKCKKIES